jgi:hypothetical protein
MTGFNFADNYDINMDALHNGAWKTLPSGLEVKLAYINGDRLISKLIANENYAELDDKIDKETDEEKLKALHEEKRKQIAHIYAGTVLLDWKADEEFTEEKAADMLIKYSVLFDEVFEAARSKAYFHNDIVARDVEVVKKK